MGQAEVLKILKENGGWMTSLEVCAKSQACRAAAEEALRKVFNHNEVLKKQEKINGRRVNVWKTKDA